MTDQAELDLIPSFPTLNHHLTEGTNPKTDKRPATEPEEHPDSRHRHPRNPFEAGDPTHARFTTDPVRSDLIRSDPIRNAKIGTWGKKL
ncbi:hypothetical protein PGTUg99_004568 [Puccinia graminis f. sp. tritici]|uniref:Uncharacterized protein n=1 Tax=Puccinia graminis f. sp. tritici TaxID=56615 RepID=A0A5B0QGS8_PUCGR|nr:hypothetical protein PGTUg99_012423 [Puccinia graminis f. sp. tritici]KAA1112352.1 hypothetical protein PGTUg99_004568 [Puccinia graminis f. sp. tritici]